MNIKQTLISIVFTSALGVIIGSPVATATSCAGVETAIITCEEEGTVVCRMNKLGDDGKPIPGETEDTAPNADGKCTDGSAPVSFANNGVWGILKLAINIMTAGIGILAVAGIVYGSVLYTSAGGSSEQTKKAITIITNVVIGIIAYLLMYALLNYIIPGGLFA